MKLFGGVVTSLTSTLTAQSSPRSKPLHTALGCVADFPHSRRHADSGAFGFARLSMHHARAESVHLPTALCMFAPSLAGQQP